MANIPDSLLYSDTHEWVKVEGDIVTIGITDHAQKELDNIVELDFYKKVDEMEDDLDEGVELKKGDEFGYIGSPKAGEPLFSPLSMEVVEVHVDVMDAPDMIHSDPYGEGWMLKGKLLERSELDGLMDPAGYAKFIEG